MWTDRGHPVLWYTTLIAPHASKTVFMRELLVSGAADICASPGQLVPIRLQEAERCELTTGCKLDLNAPNDLGCRTQVGNRHAHAIGYVTVDVVADCMDLTAPNATDYAAKPDSALTGKFEQIAKGRVIASGPLGDRALPRPRMPRDPLARRPPRECPPLSPPEPVW